MMHLFATERLVCLERRRALRTHMHPGALEKTAPCSRLISRIRATKHSVAKQITGEILQ
jgi:hypothetical protein